jgi:purine-nucleoside phosphorylase
MDDAKVIEQAARELSQIWQEADVSPDPQIAVILGSGLRGAADKAVVAGAAVIPYENVPGMPVTRVAGHAGRFVAGGTHLASTVLLQGRSHLYEGWTVGQTTFAVRVLANLGVKKLIVTNAAGGIRPGMIPGDLMLIEDHLSLADLSELAATVEMPTIYRRPAVVWDDELIATADALPTSLTVHRGCYAMMPGPNYETPAEVRMLSVMGADAVGMSTVPEALVASGLGMSVLGISCITNAAAGLTAATLSHEEVSETATRIEAEFVSWLMRLLQRMTLPCGHVGHGRV